MSSLATALHVCYVTLYNNVIIGASPTYARIICIIKTLLLWCNHHVHVKYMRSMTLWTWHEHSIAHSHMYAALI